MNIPIQPEPAPESRDPCAALTQELGRHARLMHMLKSRMANWAPEGLDWAAFGLLITLVRTGPRRQGELAEVCLLDPSTVSRHVGQLVRASLVERRPDPADGRAIQLVATAAGIALSEAVAQRRDALIRSMISHWDDADVHALTHLLSRLNDAFESNRAQSALAPSRPLIPHPPERDPAPGLSHSQEH